MRELEHFLIDGAYGWNQELFEDNWMNRGGCAAVTACEICICLARTKGMTNLYPFDAGNITREDYLAFARIMRPYLHPRPAGINRTSVYMDGFRDDLATCPGPTLRMRSVEGDEPYAAARQAVRDSLDRGFPVAYLMLLHTDKSLEDYHWHWFLLNAYDETPQGFMVRVVTYGEWRRFELGHLWDTGHDRKGGLVVFSKEE